MWKWSAGKSHVVDNFSFLYLFFHNCLRKGGGVTTIHTSGACGQCMVYFKELSGPAVDSDCLAIICGALWFLNNWHKNITTFKSYQCCILLHYGNFNENIHFSIHVNFSQFPAKQWLTWEHPSKVYIIIIIIMMRIFLLKVPKITTTLAVSKLCWVYTYR